MAFYSVEDFDQKDKYSKEIEQTDIELGKGKYTTGGEAFEVDSIYGTDLYYGLQKPESVKIKIWTAQDLDLTVWGIRNGLERAINTKGKGEILISSINATKTINIMEDSQLDAKLGITQEMIKKILDRDTKGQQDPLGLIVNKNNKSFVKSTFAEDSYLTWTNSQNKKQYIFKGNKEDMQLALGAIKADQTKSEALLKLISLSSKRRGGLSLILEPSGGGTNINAGSFNFGSAGEAAIVALIFGKQVGLKALSGPDLYMPPGELIQQEMFGLPTNTQIDIKLNFGDGAVVKFDLGMDVYILSITLKGIFLSTLKDVWVKNDGKILQDQAEKCDLPGAAMSWTAKAPRGGEMVPVKRIGVGSPAKTPEQFREQTWIWLDTLEELTEEERLTIVSGPTTPIGGRLKDLEDFLGYTGNADIKNDKGEITTSGRIGATDREQKRTYYNWMTGKKGPNNKFEGKESEKVAGWHMTWDVEIKRTADDKNPIKTTRTIFYPRGENNGLLTALKGSTEMSDKAEKNEKLRIEKGRRLQSKKEIDLNKALSKDQRNELIAEIAYESWSRNGKKLFDQLKNILKK